MFQRTVTIYALIRATNQLKSQSLDYLITLPWVQIDYTQLLFPLSAAFFSLMLAYKSSIKARRYTNHLMWKPGFCFNETMLQKYKLQCARQFNIMIFFVDVLDIKNMLIHRLSGFEAGQD